MVKNEDCTDNEDCFFKKRFEKKKRWKKRLVKMGLMMTTCDIKARGMPPYERPKERRHHANDGHNSQHILKSAP